MELERQRDATLHASVDFSNIPTKQTDVFVPVSLYGPSYMTLSTGGDVPTYRKWVYN